MTSRLRSGLVLLALLLVVSGGSEAWNAWSRYRLGTEAASLARAGDIQMIASDSCAVCARARAWFEANDIPFSECSIERDPACAARFDALRAPGTPVLLVRGRPQVGFSPQAVAVGLRS